MRAEKQTKQNKTNKIQHKKKFYKTPNNGTLRNMRASTTTSNAHANVVNQALICPGACGVVVPFVVALVDVAASCSFRALCRSCNAVSSARDNTVVVVVVVVDDDDEADEADDDDDDDDDFGLTSASDSLVTGVGRFLKSPL